MKYLGLVLTSKVNLNTANGKGEVELDWSGYDLEDKYFVIYRKEENANDWETIVSLEEKLTGGKYIDTFGNDKGNPSTPTINIEGNTQNNKIQLTQNATDTGTKYLYYIEAYDSGDTLLSKTNINKTY